MVAPRNMASLPQIADYWSARRAERAFPGLRAHAVGWTRPFCFRCEWRSPLPHEIRPDPWAFAKGWLERAHLKPHADGGSGTAGNLVPLCTICHRIQPSQLDKNGLVAWIRKGQPKPRHNWWQMATDTWFGGDNYRPFVGRTAFMSRLLAAGSTSWPRTERQVRP